MRACVLGLEGPILTPEELALLQVMPPAGVILFARNVVDRVQLAELTRAVRAAAAPTTPLIFIDQEGGRVMRLRPPVWRWLPSMRQVGDLHAVDPEQGIAAAFAVGQLIGHDLAEVGIDVACAPCLDVATPGLTDAIGSRSFSADPLVVGRLGRAVADGLADQGILPVMKHMPGHGRATIDSHHDLPVIDATLDELARRDLVPFRELADIPVGMTAHLLLPRIDDRHPATLSRRVIGEVIRGRIGFDGLLLSDDLGMGALKGSLAQNAIDCLDAGCDLALACSGRIEDARELTAIVPMLDGLVARRYARALARRAPAATRLDVARAEDALASLAITA